VDKLYSHDWINLNQLLRSYPGAIGIKTGTTPGAGANLVAGAVRGNRRIIAVIVADSVTARYADAMSLLDYGWRLLGYPSRVVSK
jgi:D-alanyl-D-alanine carboxypeptidase (penicillin-binding protein 5/6)